MIASERAALRVERLVVGEARANCWLVAGESDAAIVIDPGDEPVALVAEAQRLHLRPVLLVATHAHADHIGAAAELRREWRAPLLVHTDDRSTLRRANLIRLAFRQSPIEVPEVDRWHAGGEETLSFGDVSIRLLDTAGHTPGGMTIAVVGGDARVHLFTGDTLLRGAVGRTDLPGGDPDALVRSLRLLATYPRDALVHPGHGDSTDLGSELEGNVSLQELLG